MREEPLVRDPWDPVAALDYTTAHVENERKFWSTLGRWNRERALVTRRRSNTMVGPILRVNWDFPTALERRASATTDGMVAVGLSQYARGLLGIVREPSLRNTVAGSLAAVEQDERYRARESIMESRARTEAAWGRAGMPIYWDEGYEADSERGRLSGVIRTVPSHPDFIMYAEDMDG